MAYPLATTWFAITVMLLMMRLYLPGFGQDIQALLETSLPPFSAILFGLAEGVRNHWFAVATVYVFVLAGVVWLFSELRDARRLLQRLLGVLPGTRGVVACLDLARVCGVSSVLLRRGTPLPEVFAVSAGMAQDPALAQRLDSLRQQCEAGRSLQESADTEGLPANLALCLRHTRAADLPDELEAMREHYTRLADSTARRVGIVWQVGAILGMGLAAGAVILAMFMPLIELYRRMAVN
jgi:type II secretory pathway component PulF